MYGNIKILDDVVIKTLDPYYVYGISNNAIDMNASFIREVAILNIMRDRSDYIIKIISNDVEKLSFEMERHKYTLNEFFDANSNIEIDSIKRIFYQILLGLRNMQDNYILHRDIKPQNILIDDDLNVKIIDMGLSCYNWTHFTDFDRIQTNEYQSPESILYDPFDIDPYIDLSKIDIWGVGLILLDLIYGNLRSRALSFSHNYLETILYYLYISYGDVDEDSYESILSLYMRIDNVEPNQEEPKYGFIGYGFINLDKVIENIMPSLVGIELDNYNYQQGNTKAGDRYLKYVEYLTENSVDYLRITTPVKSFSRDTYNILKRMLAFSPKSRSSLEEIMRDPFFAGMSSEYIYTKYDAYSEPVDSFIKLSDIEFMNEDRENIIYTLIDMSNSVRAKYIHFLNAIHIIDLYTVLDIENSINSTNIELFMAAALIISMKLYRYIDMNTDENYYNPEEREEDSLISGFIYWFEDRYGEDDRNWESIANHERYIISELTDYLYVPKSIFTDDPSENMRINYVKILMNTDYKEISYKRLIEMTNLDYSVVEDIEDDIYLVLDM